MPVENAVDQAESQSMEDRIAGQFELPEDEPQEAQENIQPEGQDEVESAEVEIEYEGEKFKIPRQLEKSILQERDYTRKSQELAEQRRQVEHERKVSKGVQMDREFNQSIATEVDQLRAIDGYMKHLEGIDVRTLPLDDQIAHLAEISRVPRQREAIQRSIEGKRAEFDKSIQEHLVTIRQSTKEALSKSIPGFSDELLTTITSYSKTLGFTEQDIDAITTDPRSSSVLYKAMQYDKLQSSKADAVKKATSASPTIKPGSSNPMTQTVKDKLSFHKSMKAATTAQEKANLIQKRLEASF
jgi:hypothetical protein